MNPYTYDISLRVFHASIDPQTITNTLGLEPARSWKAGSPRTTPIGSALDGHYEDSYWSAKLTQSGPVHSEHNPIEDYISSAANKLESFTPFFELLRSEGGRAEFFVGLYGNQNFGIELSSELLSTISSLGLSLSLDIYP